MTARIAINGYGRIGRNILRAVYESGFRKQLEIVAINDLGDSRLNAHLTQYDSVHGHFSIPVNATDQALTVGSDQVRTFSEREPEKLPWRELGVDIVLECTGLFTSREAASLHLKAGAKKVIVSAPASGVDATIVYGVNHHVLNSDMTVISNASCTTNCLAPVVKVLNDNIGIEQGSMTTVHAYTNDQNLNDVYHDDIYRARSATQSIIPTKTGAARAIGLVLPELNGKLDGMAVRVPTVNVSMVDLNFLASRETSIEQINHLMLEASQSEQLNKVLGYNELPLVSVDFNHNPVSSIFDATQTQVNGRWVKVISWYDNEWGFANRMLDTAMVFSQPE